MKKLISLILTVVLLLTASCLAVAEEENSAIVFSLQCNGKNTETVKAGTEIQVDLFLESDNEYDVITLTDEIDFDEAFFDYVGEITPVADKVSGERQTYTGGDNIIKVVGFYSNGKTYETSQHIISFELKVKEDAVGIGIIKSDPDTVMVCGNSEYESSNKDLTIIIGDGQTEKRALIFETNNGDKLDPVIKNKGESVNLSEYTPTRTNYTFEGWYTDNETFKNKVTSVTLDDNVTVYAKWKKTSTGGGGGSGGSGGGGSVSAYTVSFETNGGTSISPVSKTKNTTVDLTRYTTIKEGFDFGGWYTEAELKNKVTEITVTENIVLYAKWTDEAETGTNRPGNKPEIFTDEHYAYIVGREDGLFYPNDDLTRAEAAEMLYRLLTDEVRSQVKASTCEFADVKEGDWFNTSVSALASLGVIKGRTIDSFAPNEAITRAEFTTMMARLSGAAYDGENVFDDISEHWAREYINIAASLGWVEGENGAFRPDDNITRAEVVTLINRVLGRLPESKADLLDNMITPPDNTDESAWYYLAVQEAVNGHNCEMKSDGVHEKWTELIGKADK